MAIGGQRRKTRYIFKKNIRTKGKISLSRYFQTFDVGQRANLVVEPSVHEGLYTPRFHGKTGLIKGMQGKCYLVEIKDGGVTKTLIVHPAHLQKC